ncbi:MAG TPA: hypothetical protein VFI18_10310 [Gaiellales bacterium]|nr:hypothetical protein [Gaiellales bacterium]
MAGASTTAVRREELAELYAAERQQKDNLCGCFWASLILRAAGVEADQDEVAAAAGAILPGGDPEMHVAPGATPRNDYRVELEIDPAPGVAGTSASAIARAIERLSGGGLAAIPVAGPWTAESVAALMEAAADATLIANVRTGRFWGSRPGPATVLAHLRGEDVEPPPADWDVGHFVNLAALVRGPADALVVVRDTYQELGVAGHHLQPPDRVAAALRRDDGHEGGVLAVAGSTRAPGLRGRLESEGFELRHWHNGTPDPEGTT